MAYLFAMHRTTPPWVRFSFTGQLLMYFAWPGRRDRRRMPVPLWCIAFESLLSGNTITSGASFSRAVETRSRWQARPMGLRRPRVMVPGFWGTALVSMPSCSGRDGGEGAGPGVVPAAGGARGMGTAWVAVAVQPAGAVVCWYEAHACSRVGWLRGVAVLFARRSRFFCAVSLLGLGCRMGSPVSLGA